jgi:hypothetical protein
VESNSTIKRICWDCGMLDEWQREVETRLGGGEGGTGAVLGDTACRCGSRSRVVPRREVVVMDLVVTD